MSDFLKKIRDCTQNRNKEICKEALDLQIQHARLPHDFLTLFKNDLPIIAEVKFASPSHGKLYTSSPNPCFIANEYLKNGAAALSILTEPDYFKGNIQYLFEVRQAYPDALILMKDFVIDEVQLLQARIAGADAVLLIAGFLEPDLLKTLYKKAIDLKLSPLIEVHSDEDLEIALRLNPKLIGINNRNLHTLSIDLKTSFDLIDLIPNDVWVLSESGVQTAAQLKSLTAAGFDGFLIGSALMKTQAPGLALRALF